MVSFNASKFFDRKFRIFVLGFRSYYLLNEYVERFGSKRCITNDIYLSEMSLRGKEGIRNENTMTQALQNDLLYVVETTCYLPFTRKGTITLNGDRRIKVGTFIILESTQELFYVTAVNNTVTFTMMRLTVLRC